MAAIDLTSQKTRAVEILDLISQPAAPYYENRVKQAIFQAAKPLLSHPKVRWFEDRYGNVMLSFWNAEKPDERPLALAAHMDHPGYDILSGEGNRVLAEIMGGLPRDERLVGSGVLIVAGEERFRGIVKDFKDEKREKVWIECGQFSSRECRGIFGVPDVERFRVESNLIHGRAMDDLAGCSIELAAMERVIGMNLPVDFMVMFHRAEEIGFMGAAGACSLASVPRHAVVVSLEASRNLEGARPGQGIVIRTGDRLNMFDPNAEKLLDTAAEKVGADGFQFQKRLMDGGACEASLYYAHGYETTAAAVPLINYHNQGETAVEAEAIDIFDLNSGVELMVQAAALMPEFKRLHSSEQLKRMERHFMENRHRLFESA